MELYEAQNNYHQKVRRRQQAESEQATAEERVRRLRAAYSKVNEVYERAKGCRDTVKRQLDIGDEWRGSRTQACSRYVEEVFLNSYEAYINQLDDIQDDIHTELTRQENEVLRLNGDIFGLGQAINNLWNFIQNCENNR